MAVTIQHDLLRYHSSLHFRLVHAAIGSYPVYGINRMAVNRILMIYENSDGGGSFIRDCTSGDLFHLIPGTIYFIPCHHEIETKLTEGLLFVSFQFNLDSFYGFDIFRNYGRCVPIKKPKLISEAKSFFNRETDPWMLCRVNEIIFRLCSHLLKYEHNIEHINHLTASQYTEILDYLQHDADATTTVADMAITYKMRQDVFSRKFTREMGMTPKALIDNAVLRKANRLLLTSRQSIKEISHELKFSSECYFSRFFKKHIGISPRSFRNLHSIKM